MLAAASPVRLQSRNAGQRQQATGTSPLSISSASRVIPNSPSSTPGSRPIIRKSLLPVADNKVHRTANKSKRSHRKSRGGCLTCKFHRVKCDETQPICLRCERLVRKCGGYPAKNTTITRRALQPKEPSMLQTMIEPSQQLFNNHREYQYFALFSDNLAAMFSPYFAASGWKQMILQACASDRTIREVAIAIAALDLTLVVGSRNDPGFAKQWITSKHLPPPGIDNYLPYLMTDIQSQQLVSTSHHQFALEKYDRAVRRMRENVACGKQSIRATLITCIITTCFEVMHGSHDAASAQLQSGIILYQDWKSRQPNASNHPMGFSSPAPHVVDDFLSQTFGRMELQTMSFTDKRPIECHRELLFEGSKTVYNMPAEFTSLEEARIYLDLIMRRILHYVGAVSLSHLQHLTGPPAVSRLFSRKSNMTATFGSRGSDFDKSGFGSAYHQQQLSEIGMRADGAQFTSDQSRWSDSFDFILAQCSLPNSDPSEKIAAFTVKIAALASQICASGTMNRDETRYDIFMVKFQQVVDYAEELLRLQEAIGRKQAESTRPCLLFCFEMGVIPPLSIVAIKCRSSKLRRKALALLLKYPRREGVWDSAVTADLSKWAISLEEGWEGEEDPYTEDSEDIFIPEYKRVQSVGLQYELERTKVAMGCLQMDLSSGEWVARNKDYVCDGWGLPS